MIINSEEARAWLRLLLTPGVGPVSVRRLLAALGSPQAVCAASAATLGQLVPAREAQALAAPSDEATALFEDQWARTAAWLADRPHRHLVSLGDARYPVRWLDLADRALYRAKAAGRNQVCEATGPPAAAPAAAQPDAGVSACARRACGTPWRG